MKNRSTPPEPGNFRLQLLGSGGASPKLQKWFDDLERFRALLDHANDIILLALLDSRRVVDANATACRKLGYPCEELVGIRVEEVVDFESLHWPEVEESGECRTIATRLHRRGGGAMPVEMLFCMDEFGGSTYVVIVARDITERLRAEEELRKSEWEKALILDSTRELVVYHDRDMRIVWANRAAAESVHLTSEEMKGLCCWKLWHQRDSPCRDCPVVGSIRTGQPQRAEVVSPDGRIWLIRSYPARNAAGEVEGAVELCLDITERKQVEEALYQSRKQFRDLVETINDWVWEVDNKGVYSYASPRVRDLLGYEPEEVVGITPFDLMPESEAERISKFFADKIKRQEAFSSIENINRHKDGHLVVLETSGAPFFDDERNLLGYRGVDRDITDRKRVEEALQESEERFRATFNQVAVGIGLVAPDGRWLRINQKYCDIVGYTEEEMRALTIRDITHPDDRETSLENFRLMLEGKLAEYSLEKRYIRKDGSTIWVHLNASIVTDAAGNPRFALGVVEDITDRRRAEEVLRESDRMKTEFISTAAHELRTPLTSILGFSQVLLNQDGLSATERREFLSYIHQKAKVLTDLVADLLDIARIESGQGLAMHPVTCTPADLVGELAPLLQVGSERSRYELSITGETVSLQADRRKITQVFENLLSNALKYSPPQSPIRIAGELAGNDYLFSVSDRGVGMSREQAGRVFDKFYRADASDTAVGGLGLGMSIVRSIVEAHGGRIWVESEAGKGTTVRFTLPADRRTQLDKGINGEENPDRR